MLATNEGGEALPDVLTDEHFVRHVGKAFDFKSARRVLTLDRVISENAGLQPPGRRRPFTLIFRGPRERDALPEGLHECEVEGGPSFSLYVGPIQTLAADRQEYQAVFN